MKDFNTLYNVELENTKTYRGYTYLPWEQCLLQFRKASGVNDLTFNFDPTEWTPPSGPTNSVYAIVHVNIHADEKHWKLAYPVIDGDIAIANPNSMQIHFAHQRAFVKCIAINSGFGLRLWEKAKGQEASCEKRDLGVDIVKMFGQLVPRYGSAKALHSEIGFSEIEVRKAIKAGPPEIQEKIFTKLQSYFQDDLK